MNKHLFDKLQSDALTGELSPYAPEANADAILARSEKKARTSPPLEDFAEVAETDLTPTIRRSVWPAIGVSAAACAVLVCSLGGILGMKPDQPPVTVPGASTATEIVTQELPFGEPAAAYGLGITDVVDGTERQYSLNEVAQRQFLDLLHAYPWGEVYDIETSVRSITTLNRQYFCLSDTGLPFYALYIELDRCAITWREKTGAAWHQVMIDREFANQLVSLLRYSTLEDTAEKDLSSLYFCHTTFHDARLVCSRVDVCDSFYTLPAEQDAAAKAVFTSLTDQLTPVTEDPSAGSCITLFTDHTDMLCSRRYQCVLQVWENDTITERFTDRGITYHYQCPAGTYAALHDATGEAAMTFTLPYAADDPAHDSEILSKLFLQSIPGEIQNSSSFTSMDFAEVLLMKPAFAPSLLELPEAQMTDLVAQLRIVPWQSIRKEEANPDGESIFLFVKTSKETLMDSRYYAMRFYMNGQMEVVHSAVTSEWYQTSADIYGVLNAAVRQLDDLPAHLLENPYEDTAGNGMAYWQAVDDAAEQIDLSAQIAAFEALAGQELNHIAPFDFDLQREKSQPGRYADKVRKLSALAPGEIPILYLENSIEYTPFRHITADKIAAVTYRKDSTAEEVTLTLTDEEVVQLMEAVSESIGEQYSGIGCQEPDADFTGDRLRIWLNEEFVPGEPQYVDVLPEHFEVRWHIRDTRVPFYWMSQESQAQLQTAIAGLLPA